MAVRIDNIRPHLFSCFAVKTENGNKFMEKVNKDKILMVHFTWCFFEALRCRFKMLPWKLLHFFLRKSEACFSEHAKKQRCYEEWNSGYVLDLP